MARKKHPPGGPDLRSAPRVFLSSHEWLGKKILKNRRKRLSPVENRKRFSTGDGEKKDRRGEPDRRSGSPLRSFFSRKEKKDPRLPSKIACDFQRQTAKRKIEDFSFPGIGKKGKNFFPSRSPPKIACDFRGFFFPLPRRGRGKKHGFSSHFDISPDSGSPQILKESEGTRNREKYRKKGPKIRETTESKIEEGGPTRDQGPRGSFVCHFLSRCDFR